MPKFASRSLFRADAVFETSLGSLLVIGTAAGWLAAGEIPLSRDLLYAGGAAFLLGGAGNALLSIRPRFRRELAIGNLAMGLAGLIWLLSSRGFSTGGAAIIAASAAWKLGLSALQLRAIRAPHQIAVA